MIPLDIDLVKSIADHIASLREGFEEGYLTLDGLDVPDEEKRVVRALLLQTQGNLLDALQRAAARALLAAMGEANASEPIVVMSPSTPIEA